jgi:hypothetical protein
LIADTRRLTDKTLGDVAGLTAVMAYEDFLARKRT